MKRVASHFENKMLKAPLVPSRGTYWIWFALSMAITFGMLPYLVWAYGRGQIGWSQLWATEIQFVFGGIVFGAIGLIARWRWQRKRKALLNYELMIASLPYPE